MRRRPYQSRGDQNKQRINQLEKFDSETAQGESFKLKLWKGRVFTFQEESTFAPTSSTSSEGLALPTSWVSAHSPCGTGFPSQPHRVMFSSQPCSQAPTPQQQNRSGVSLATASFAGTEVSKSFRVALQSWDQSPRLGGMTTPATEHQHYP